MFPITLTYMLSIYSPLLLSHEGIVEKLGKDSVHFSSTDLAIQYMIKHEYCCLCLSDLPFQATKWASL